MDALNQPHDKFFRATFGKLKVSSNFLNTYLPNGLLNIIDINTLELQKESFLDEDLREEFSDLLFRVNINNKDGYIYLLFEHKAYRDRKVIFQVMKYMINIWESKIEDDKEKRKEAGEPNSGEMELPLIDSSGSIPKYAVPGNPQTKSIYMSQLLSKLINDFSETKNLSQREIVEAALIDYLKRYGYQLEVEKLLSRK